MFVWKLFFHQRINQYCARSFQTFWKLFQSKRNFNVGLKVYIVWKVFQNIWKLFQSKWNLSRLSKKKWLFSFFFLLSFIFLLSNIFCGLFGKLSGRGKTFRVAMLPCYRGFSLSEKRVPWNYLVMMPWETHPEVDQEKKA